jgi:hypothetical protein
MAPFMALMSWLLASFTALVTLAAAYAQTGDVAVVRRTLRWSGTGRHTLEVSNVRGSIHVVAVDGSTVDVVARRSGPVSETHAPAFREGNDAIEVCGDADRCGCHLSTPGRPWRDEDRVGSVDLELRVPRDAELTVCAINHGEVTVAGMSGDFDVSNVNGPVHLSDMRGSGTATTVNGDVTASFAESPRSPSSFKTVNGDIEAHFPSDLAADLRLKTMNGGLFTDFDVTATPAAALTVERRDGRYVYRSNRFASVRVGHGGPELTFEGLNSEIRVLRNQ